MAWMSTVLSETSGSKASGRNTAATVVSGETKAASWANACSGRTSLPISTRAICGRRLRAASIAWRTSQAWWITGCRSSNEASALSNSSRNRGSGLTIRMLIVFRCT